MSVLVSAGEGRELHAFGEVMTVEVNGSQTGGSLAVVSAVTPSGVGPPPHIHHNEDELFIVVEGSISYFSDDEWRTLGPGGVAFLPRDRVHTYRNDGATPSRHWIITQPSGFEMFFAEAADEFGRPGDLDMGRIVDLSRRYGIDLLLPEAP